MANVYKVVLFLLVSLAAFGQGSRYDNFVWTTASVGNLSPIVPVPGSTVKVCLSPANSVPCTNYINIYSDQGLTTLINQTTNPITADAQGNFGFWTNPGTYQYTVCTPSPSVACSGPYNISIPFANGSSAFITGSTGTLSSPLLNQASGGSWFANRYDGTVNYSGPVIAPFANAYIGSTLWLESHGLLTNLDQLFTLSSFVDCGTPSANTNTNHSNSKVAVYAAAHRFPDGSPCTVTGLNSLSEGDPNDGYFASIEADANAYGHDAPYPQNGTFTGGIQVASGGTKKPEYGLFLTSNNAATNAFNYGIYVNGFAHEGIRVAGVTGGGTDGVIMSAFPPASTSLGTQQNSLSALFQDNRWNGSANTQDSFRIQLAPDAGGTDSSLNFLNNNNVSILSVFGSTNNPAVTIGAGSLAMQVQGYSTFTSFDVANPGIRITPANDTAANALCVTNAANSLNNACIAKNGQYISTLTTGTAPFDVTSTTPVPHLTAVPSTYNRTGVQLTEAHVVVDKCTLGTDCSVTLSGSAVFTSSSSYQCSAIDETTAAAVKFAPTSGSAFTFTGTGADVISYVCVGN